MHFKLSVLNISGFGLSSSAHQMLLNFEIFPDTRIFPSKQNGVPAEDEDSSTYIQRKKILKDES